MSSVATNFLFFLLNLLQINYYGYFYIQIIFIYYPCCDYENTFDKLQCYFICLFSQSYLGRYYPPGTVTHIILCTPQAVLNRILPSPFWYFSFRHIFHVHLQNHSYTVSDSSHVRINSTVYYFLSYHNPYIFHNIIFS